MRFDRVWVSSCGLVSENFAYPRGLPARLAGRPTPTSGRGVWGWNSLLQAKGILRVLGGSLPPPPSLAALPQGPGACPSHPPASADVHQCRHVSQLLPFCNALGTVTTSHGSHRVPRRTVCGKDPEQVTIRKTGNVLGAQELCVGRRRH